MNVRKPLLIVLAIALGITGGCTSAKESGSTIVSTALSTADEKLSTIDDLTTSESAQRITSEGASSVVDASGEPTLVEPTPSAADVAVSKADMSVEITVSQLRAAAAPNADPEMVRDTCYALFGDWTMMSEAFGITEKSEFKPLPNDEGISCFYGKGTNGNSAAMLVWLNPFSVKESSLGAALNNPNLESGGWIGPFAGIGLTVASGMIDADLADQDDPGYRSHHPGVIRSLV